RRVARPSWIPAGNTEAVFSSSEDRIRASQAKAAVAGSTIASGSRQVQTSSLQIGRGWFEQGWFEQGWTSQIAESLFAVLFPSDCRICGTPLIRISRLPVCQECLDAMLPTTGGVCATCGE